VQYFKTDHILLAVCTPTSMAQTAPSQQTRPHPVSGLYTNFCCANCCCFTTNQTTSCHHVCTPTSVVQTAASQQTRPHPVTMYVHQPLLCKLLHHNKPDHILPAVCTPTSVVQTAASQQTRSHPASSLYTNLCCANCCVTTNQTTSCQQFVHQPLLCKLLLHNKPTVIPLNFLNLAPDNPTCLTVWHLRKAVLSQEVLP
jgi:hypothetical protein